MGNVFLADNMPALEGCTLEAVLHLGYVMAKLHADCVFHVYLFHIKNPFRIVSASSAALPAGTTAITLHPMALLITALP